MTGPQAVTMQEAFKANFPSYRVAFGVGLERWRRKNGWTQDTAMDIGQICGVPHVYGSKWSQLERGVASNPGPTVFYALGVLNECLHNGHFLTPGLLPKNLREKALSAEPVLLADGTRWRGMHFYATFVGNMKWPDLVMDKFPTFDEAKSFSEDLAARFRKVRDQNQLKISTAVKYLTSLEVTGQSLDENVIEKMSAVALGMEEYKPFELSELWDQSRQEYLPQIWMNAFAAYSQRISNA